MALEGAKAFHNHKRQGICLKFNTNNSLEEKLMKTQSVTIMLIILLVVLSVGMPRSEATLYFQDGQTHDIDYIINDNVRVDLTYGVHTEVNLLPTGQIVGYLIGNYDSRLNISGGTIDNDLVAFRNSQVIVSGGKISGKLYGEDDSKIEFNGGLVGNLMTINHAQIKVSGGKIVGDIHNGYESSDYSQITFLGSDFNINGVPSGYGELKSILGGHWNDEPVRHLTGILASGELINNDFYIGGNAKIILAVPEPATLLLFGLGFVFLRKKS